MLPDVHITRLARTGAHSHSSCRRSMEACMRTLLIAVVAVASASIGVARAQDFPAHPIIMILPLPAGSAFDLTARLVAERMRVALGQPVVVENLTGASGSV